MKVDHHKILNDVNDKRFAYPNINFNSLALFEAKVKFRTRVLHCILFLLLYFF